MMIAVRPPTITRWIRFLPRNSNFCITRRPISRAFFFRANNWQLPGQSPELLISGNAQAFQTFKLSGTWPRPDDEATDDALLREMLTSQKLRNEHEGAIIATEHRLRSAGEVTRNAMFVQTLPVLCHPAGCTQRQQTRPLANTARGIAIGRASIRRGIGIAGYAGKPATRPLLRSGRIRQRRQSSGIFAEHQPRAANSLPNASMRCSGTTALLRVAAST